MGHARQGIHHQQCFLSASPESFGDRARRLGRPQSPQRCFFSSRHHHHRPRETFGSQHIINELSHFPASFPDQSDHTDLNFGMTNNLPQKGALSNAWSRKNPHALARPHGGHRIDGANTGWQRCFDQRTLQRQRCWVGQWTLGQRRQRWTSVNRTAPRIDHASQQLGAKTNPYAKLSCNHAITGLQTISGLIQGHDHVLFRSGDNLTSNTRRKAHWMPHAHQQITNLHGVAADLRDRPRPKKWIDGGNAVSDQTGEFGQGLVGRHGHDNSSSANRSIASEIRPSITPVPCSSRTSPDCKASSGNNSTRSRGPRACSKEGKSNCIR